MSLTTCSKGHCWNASLDNGWCNKHTNERIAELETKVAALKADAKFVYDDCWMRADLSADGKVPISYSAWMKICRMAQESE